MKNEIVPNRVGRLRVMVIRLWQPAPLSPPTVSRQLALMHPIVRISEVLRYSWLRLEYWISPGGRLREWARFNVGLALLIGIPATVLMPIVTFLLQQLTGWSLLLVQITQNFLIVLLLLLGALAVLTALLCFVRGWFGK